MQYRNSLSLLTIIGLGMDLAGAVVVLAPEWTRLDSSIKRSASKISVFGKVPIVGRPIKKLDDAHTLDYVYESFVVDGNTVGEDDPGFRILKRIVDKLKGDNPRYDYLHPDSTSGIVTRGRSSELLEDNPDIENIWGTGDVLRGPPMGEVIDEIESRKDRIMFRMGVILLATGFIIQIVSKSIRLFI